LKSARERMNIISAYHQVGIYRGAAGTTHKTVKCVVKRAEAGGPPPRGAAGTQFRCCHGPGGHRVEASHGKMSAKLVVADRRAAGYEGSARNFRRLVAERKVLWRKANAHVHRPAVWSPG
jgi:hypothetical protein